MKNQYLITFRSITYAQRGQQALRQAGIDSHLQRTPRELSGRGCGYGLRISGRDAAGATMLLEEKGIPYNKVFAPGQTGSMEEWRR